MFSAAYNGRMPYVKKKPEERETPGRKPGSKGPETVELRYRLPVPMATWLAAHGGSRWLKAALTKAMAEDND